MNARHDSSQPRIRRGAHRTRRSLLGALMPSVLAVAAVASLITALAVWQGEQPGQPVADAAARTSSSPVATPSARTDAAKAVSTPSSVTTSTPETTPATEVEGTKAEATPSSKPSSVDRTAYEVVVLNQSSRAGLAATVGQDLRDQGWTVPAVGNFRGIVPSTTVYYPAGAETAALAVASDLRSEPRIRPRFGNLSTTRLTVVVTTSYPG
jgi:LytR cell envelope-related transcriptional attenuator